MSLREREGKEAWVRDPKLGKWVQRANKVKPPGPGPGWRKGQKGCIRLKKASAMTLEERIAILTMAEKGKGPADIARAMGRSYTTISRYLARMTDTTALARATIKSGASTLAERVVKQATVSEAIEVLSRPGIDVLQPQQANSGKGGGFRVSVGVGSCGTVVQVEGGDVKQLSEAKRETVPG